MKAKTYFYCTECGNESLKWLGKCPSCGAWNTLVEREKESTAKHATHGSIGREKNPFAYVHGTSDAKKFHEIGGEDALRFATKMGELDRVLGGGIVRGSLVLVGGEPGIGKSTLMLQISQYLSENAKVLYVSGEESQRQLKMRGDRLGIKGDELYVYGENALESILGTTEALSPDILIVDSIQTIYHKESSSAAGSISQIRDCTMRLMHMAKGKSMAVFIVSHVNKEGGIAGPKLLEHMVDCVLYFEGEQRSAYRILRAVKNRYGATNEIGMFEMGDRGLVEITNPSKALLSGRVKNASGSAVTCVLEGIRPVLAEVQGLLVQSNFGTPRRTSNGLDYNRAVLLQAVLEKRGGLPIGACDVYLNVVGGLSVSEPSADLAVILAMASSFWDRALPEDLVAIGEVGLTGELRMVNQLEQRLQEIHRLGFTKCIIPKGQEEKLVLPKGLRVIPVGNIREALMALKGQ